MLYETMFLKSLFLTLLIEIPLLFIFVKYIFKIRFSNKKIFFAGLISSVLTLPYLWFVMRAFINANYYIQIGELVVILIEALIYNQLLEIRFDKSFLMSLVINIISFALGILILA